MKYELLTDKNMIGRERWISDGYNGHIILVSYHKIDGRYYLKHRTGCFPVTQEIGDKFKSLVKELSA